MPRKYISFKCDRHSYSHQGKAPTPVMPFFKPSMGMESGHGVLLRRCLKLLAVRQKKKEKLLKR
jgi:hypothetical protein